MKRLLIVLGVLVLLVGGLVGTLTTTVGAKEAGPQSKTFVVYIGDITFPESQFSINLNKGERMYGEASLVDTEGEIIGELKYNGVSTSPIGVFGWWEAEHFHIFGEGTIEGISYGGEYEGKIWWKGAIIGGTGRFAGASGEYSGVEGSVTFTFEKPLKPHP